MLGVGLAAVAAACAPALAEPDVPLASDIPVYEARVARDSADLVALLPLAAAYRDAGRVQAALPLLERAVAEAPDEAAAALMLGLVYQDLDRFADAAAQYERAARLGHSPGFRTQSRGRAHRVRRQQWIRSARDAVANEAALASTPPQPRSVAVLPFVYQGADPELEPLGRALAELTVTDLARVERLRVLERARVQLLVQEARLAEQGLVDPATAVRGGRLLRAAHLVQGTIGAEADALELRAAVIEVDTGHDPRVDPLTERDVLQNLFAMQQRLVLGILASLAIELTPAERARVTRRPTANLQALLAFGSGLEAEDVGAYANAAQHFAHAVALDPGFALAGARAADAAAAARAAATGDEQLIRQALGELGAARAGLAAVEEMVPEAGGRDAASEALGQEFVGSQGAVLRILGRPRPGGGS